MKLTVKDLRKSIKGMRGDVPIVFEGNVMNKKSARRDEPTYTVVSGYPFSTFERKTNAGETQEFVMVYTITELDRKVRL